MKTLNITFEDKEYNLLKKEKGNLSWHDLIIKLVKEKKEKWKH